MVSASVLLGGCANPGPPRPPSLGLPAVVGDLKAERTGGRVLLRWTTPGRSTDDLDLKGVLTAEVCREAGARPTTPAARAAACSPVRRLTVTPGASQVWDDLPSALVADPVVLLTYKVQIRNGLQQSAGESAPAYAAAGAAPEKIDPLRVTASEGGAVIEWAAADPKGGAAATTVDLKRMDLSSPAVKSAKPQGSPAKVGKKHKTATMVQSGETQPMVHLRSVESDGGAGGTGLKGTLDATAVMGDTYTYVAERVRSVTVGGHALEIRGETSLVATLVMRDTFPPAAPAGLATIAGAAAAGPYIDLSWEPNGEKDLAGYLVYRQLARPDGSRQGPLARLTPVSIIAPAYRDVAVMAGQRYIYRVTSVDAAGNESAPSAQAQEDVASPK